jgi:hypothetical protein
MALLGRRPSKRLIGHCLMTQIHSARFDKGLAHNNRAGILDLHVDTQPRFGASNGWLAYSSLPVCPLTSARLATAP